MIHKPDKKKIVLDVLSPKMEYQGEMPWENTQILRTMFVGKNDLKRKI
jgi:hypothetical protein